MSGSANGAAAAYAAADAGAVIAVGSNGEACAPDDIACELEGFMDPGSSGSLMTAAEEALSAREAADAAADAVASTSDAASATADAADAAAAPRSSAGTPYSAPGGRWARFKKYSAFQRSWEIWTFALAFFFRLWLVGRAFTYGRAGMTEARVSARRSALAVWLREGLVRLGPTFIKVGQQFSTRIDVLSPEFIKELEVLQDNVPPFPSETAVAIVEAAFGKPLLETYESFDPTPIAAASLGQVHVARVGGRKVVVKVQRPGLKALFDIDLKNVRALAQWLQAVDPKSDGAARDWVAIYDECSRILYQEIDYTAEGRNADEFRQNFAKVPWVKVPEVIWALTTPEVLTMEYAPGVKINRVAELDRMGVDRQLLARRTVESYLQQILTHGLFHAGARALQFRYLICGSYFCALSCLKFITIGAHRIPPAHPPSPTDPHPGNVAVDAEGGGRLVYYDFGMMGRIPNDVRGGLVELFYAVYQKDVDGCMSALVKMGVLVPGGDPVAVRRTGEFFLRSFEDRLAAQRAERAENEAAYTAGYKPAASKEDKKAKRKQLLAAIGEDLLVASSDKPFRFPATFTFGEPLLPRRRRCCRPARARAAAAPPPPRPSARPSSPLTHLSPPTPAPSRPLLHRPRRHRQGPRPAL